VTDVAKLPTFDASRSASLASLQATLSVLFRRQAAIAKEPALTATAVAIATGNPRVTPAEQLDIYRRQFWLRHHDSLLEDFPGLAYVLRSAGEGGEDALDDFFTAYLVACPPRSPSLRDLPFEAAAFAATYAFPEGKAGLARAMIDYELAFIEIFDGPEPAPLDGARIAAMPMAAWETARFVVSPVVRRLSLAYPVHQLRLAIRSGETPALPPAAEPAPVELLLFRQDDLVRFEALEPDASALLDLLSRGTPLVPACSELSSGRSEEEVAVLGQKVGGWFKRFAELGVFADIVEMPADPS
jgi:hypothetical protein